MPVKTKADIGLAVKVGPPYSTLDVGSSTSCVILDHMGGFDVDQHCLILDRIINDNQQLRTIGTEYVLSKRIQDRYPTVRIQFALDTWNSANSIDTFVRYREHPQLDFKSFLCSFAGSDHVSRKFLVAILHRWAWFDTNTCSKNFQFTADQLDGHIGDYLTEEKVRIYRKFFLTDTSPEFFQTINAFNYHRFDHLSNIHSLSPRITQCFLHLISETMATSFYPFVTEKFLYSVVNRGLFLSYAQPGWHDHLERHYGFKKYHRLFDYSFDAVQNPVERLIELVSMIAKFSVLSCDDWRDLYEIEVDTIEYNYDHYFSGNYLKQLEQFC